jgi:membrane-bound lytic murein transglycosylase B
LVTALAAGACTGSSPSRVATRDPSSPAPASATASTAAAAAPGVAEPVPRSAQRLAAALEGVTRDVRDSVDEWTSDGDPATWPPPKTLVLQTLYQERIYRTLATRPRLARRVVARLPASVRAEASAIVRADAAVFAHATPVRPSYRIRTRAPEPADVLRGYFEEGTRRFGVPWEILAAVNYVETKFGRVISNSSAGAQGPMQFLPTTWAAYGLGGDVHDPHDAILGAANYLHANGAPRNVRGALYHYNPVDAYVEAVTSFAKAMRRDPRLYYAMYCWQVYILTTHGDRRITGPGV